MATYLTSADLQGRLKENFSRLYDLPADQADLDRDIEGVEALVNSFLGRRYQVPVVDSSALRVVQALALDLLEEQAWRRATGSEIPKKAEDAAAIARKHLEQIAAGKMTLAGAGAAESESAGAGAILVDGNAPQFKRSDMDGY